MRQAFFFAIVLASYAGCAPSQGADDPTAKPIVIPLKDIWAWEMPGTRDVFELEPPVSGPEAKSLPLEEIQRRNRDSLVQKIPRLLRPSPFIRPTEIAGPGFAVQGTGKKALEQAYDVFAKKEKPRESFVAGDDITAIFFSYSLGSYVHIQEIERRGNLVEIRYRFTPHFTKETTSHFALIPLGQIPAGEYQVKIVKLPVAEEFAKYVRPSDRDWAKEIVCKSFSFSVEQQHK
jgi:hypothetical protein